MRILAISTTHDASAAIVENGKLVYYRMSERLTRIKHDQGVSSLFDDIIKYKDLFFDAVIILNNEISSQERNYRLSFLIQNNLITNNIILTYANHHLFHAYCGFYNSNFQTALCIVVDGMGSSDDENSIEFRKNSENKNLNYREKESLYIFSKNSNELILKNYYEYDVNIHGNHENRLIYAKSYDPIKSNLQRNYKKFNNSQVYDTHSNGIGDIFQYATMLLKFGLHDHGKTMGLAQYKNYENFLDDEWKNKIDLASDTQILTQNMMIDLIKEGMQKTGIKNVVISGGYGLNCVANYLYLKEIPGINLYVDPICFDAGQSIGAAYYYHKLFAPHIAIQKLENVYVGTKDEYGLDNKFKHKKVTYDDIVDILLQGEIVCLFQGQSEAGQRALGNRSMLFDPRVKNGKHIVNQIKKRESFRPFAGTILLEHVYDWFDMRGLNESPYMQFAVDTKKDKIDLIPSIVHVDGTCRIQTVTEKQNFHLYNLIKVFYNKTNVPMLLNTSFNLAGDPLVEKLKDSYNTLEKSELKYLYLPEIETLIYK